MPEAWPEPGGDRGGLSGPLPPGAGPGALPGRDALPRHLFGSLKSPFFGTGIHWLLCHPSWSTVPSKNSPVDRFLALVVNFFSHRKDGQQFSF